MVTDSKSIENSKILLAITNAGSKFDEQKNAQRDMISIVNVLKILRSLKDPKKAKDVLMHQCPECENKTYAKILAKAKEYGIDLEKE